MGALLSCLKVVADELEEVNRQNAAAMQTSQAQQHSNSAPNFEPSSEISSSSSPANLSPLNESQRILLAACPSLSPRESNIIQKLVYDTRSGAKRQITAEEQAIALRIMTEFQSQVNSMTNTAMEAAGATANMASSISGLRPTSSPTEGSIAGLRQSILQQGIEEEDRRQSATSARIAEMQNMRYDPEASGYNETVRMHNQNVLDQLYGYQIGNGGMENLLPVGGVHSTPINNQNLGPKLEEPQH